jgi:hypothetical protein
MGVGNSEGARNSRHTHGSVRSGQQQAGRLQGTNTLLLLPHRC